MNKFRASLFIAILFFVIGTLLLVLQAIYGDITSITFAGYYFVLIAIVLNLAILLVLVVVLSFFPEKRETLKSIGVILLNIPIAYIYYLIVMTYLI